MTRTLVTFHAHPDDEALLTAGTMARAAAEGHRVVLVFATRGDVGQVGSDVLGDGESLAARRTAEAERSAEILGVARVEFLPYGDSGHQGERLGTDRDAAQPPFAGVAVDDAATRLAAILREEDADVLTVYDANGGYGHPDHLQVRAVGLAAAALAQTPTVLEATINRDLMKMGVEMARSLGYELPPEFNPTTFDQWFTAQDELTHAVDVAAHLPQKRLAMEAHATQATGDEGGRTLAALLSLPDEYFAMAFSTEWFRDPALPPGLSRTTVFE